MVFPTISDTLFRINQTTSAIFSWTHPITVSDHLAKMAVLPDLLNSDLKWGFPIPQVAEKHGWTEPIVARVKGDVESLIF